MLGIISVAPGPARRVVDDAGDSPPVSAADAAATSVDGRLDQVVGEMVEEIDELGGVVGVITRAEMRRRAARHRAVFVVVVGSDGRVLVHRRADHKDVWASMWDLAVGGVVAAGEHEDDAARRELAEEIGLTDVVLSPIGGGRYDDLAVRLQGRVYLVRSDGPFRFTDGEVTAAEWMTLEELLRAVRAPGRRGPGPFVPDSVALALPLLAAHL